ncbi:AdoMet-dependent rRNA methyltransferase spb1 [Serendipita sp. 399]|nr:AdoMet-dependent rRNA methyltransferase spb1 [Serendipita sp. 399]
MGDGSNSSGDDSSASENEEEEGSDDRANHRKRKRADLHRGELTEDAAPRKRVKTSPQGNGLITMLTEHGDAALESRRASNLWFSQDIFADVNRDILANDEDDFSGTDEAENTESGSSSSQGDAPPQIEDPRESDFEIVPREKEQDEDVDMWDVEDEDIDAQKREYVRKLGLNTAEAITLAQQLVNREKTRTQLISDGFNRYSLNSKDGLPSWFLDDEAKHYKPNLPITKEAVMALRAKQKELDARPIKKIAEAKARKKLKASQKLAKAMKKAEGVNAMSDMTEKEKSSQIEQLMKKGLGKGKKKKDEVKLVVAKGANKGLKGRPKGVKGRYRMVDARGKKELRAQKRREKAKKPKRPDPQQTRQHQTFNQGQLGYAAPYPVQAPESASIPVYKTVENPTSGTQTQQQYFPGSPSTDMGHPSTDTAVHAPSEASPHAQSFPSTSRDHPALASNLNTSFYPRTSYRRRPAPKKDISDGEESEDMGLGLPDDKNNRHFDNIAGLSTHSRRKNYVSGLEGYIIDSRETMRQNNISVPPIQRSAVSRGLDTPTQNVSMGSRIAFDLVIPENRMVP